MGGHLQTDQLRLMAERFADGVAYTDLGTGSSLTFAAWEAGSNRAGRGLAAAGVAKGDRVALMIPTDEPLDWMIAYAAIHKAGAVAVPVNPRMAPPEIEHVVDRDDPADIVYTSGTTGLPKGVAVRHHNVAIVPNGVPEWTGRGWLHASPLFTFAGIASVYNPMKLGFTGLYLPRFDAGRFIGVLERERPLMVFLVPAMAQLLLAHPAFDGADLSSVAVCSVGSAPIAPDTLRRLQERMPAANVSNSYGMTEAGPAFCSMPPGEAERRPGSVGKPMPPTEFRIADDGGAGLAPGEVGEVLIRNPGRQREYYRDPEATAATWTADGWLRSGDLGFIDEDGFLYIVGRKKDVVIRGGSNVHAKDVEDVLHEHPAVQEAAVAGVPHEVLGEEVDAWVVVRPGASLGAEELVAFCRERLAAYKVPRRVTFLAELPRNATGKVLKHELVASA